jgi:hypothetical protein
MSTFEMLRREAFLTTDVSGEIYVSIIRGTGICELGTTLAVTSNRHTLLRNTEYFIFFANVVPVSPILVTLMMEALSSSETPAFTGATRRKLPEDDIIHSHRRENLKSYVIRLHCNIPLKYSNTIF